MQIAPRLDPKLHDLDPLLARRGHDIAWLNTDDGDPYSEPNVARYSLTETAKITPFHYRSALVTNPELQAWTQQLITAARRTQVQRGSHLATISHGPSLMLLGVTGVGKTHQAYGAIRELAAAGVIARWTVTTAGDLYGALRPRHGIDSEAEFERFRTSPLLFIDDLGAERKPTEFTEEVNFRLINHRYEHHLPTLLTSNLRPKELGERLGERVTSRLVEMTQRVALEGTDRRRKTGKAA